VLVDCPTALSSSTSTPSEQSQARGLSSLRRILRTLKTNLQCPASHILVGPNPSLYVTATLNVTDVPPPRSHAEAELRA
jgi:hypothetical protein